MARRGSTSTARWGQGGCSGGSRVGPGPARRRRPPTSPASRRRRIPVVGQPGTTTLPTARQPIPTRRTSAAWASWPTPRDLHRMATPTAQGGRRATPSSEQQEGSTLRPVPSQRTATLTAQEDNSTSRPPVPSRCTATLTAEEGRTGRRARPVPPPRWRQGGGETGLLKIPPMPTPTPLNFTTLQMAPFPLR